MYKNAKCARDAKYTENTEFAKYAIPNLPILWIFSLAAICFHIVHNVPVVD